LVWEQTTLETLVLAENDLTELSGRIGNLSALRMLDLGHNQLTAIPESISRLSQLRELHLRDNRLTTLPDAIAALRELRGNPLLNLPASRAGLPRIDNSISAG
jgi:Leucine-rich repeat (LRR) protein